ncbi:hypothetical protein CC78DRAFT_492052 [Lojkania enalia]|uniref:THO complex subunit 5 n=1 Tax=Lojkania enalia TaxID=147567 RepID=A0A9P4N4Y8_9PLEO|nr:hypothetical protein CC78DRAFT_492052 [Didymosphaeria enalia]
MDSSQANGTAANPTLPVDLVNVDMSSFNIGDYIRTPSIKKLYDENQKLKRMVTELAEYQIANPKVLNPTTRTEIDHEQRVEREIAKKQKYIRAQLAVVKALFRQGAMAVREEKAKTAESRSVNDQLILQLHNLNYEEQSQASEISAAQNYDHKYTKLLLVPVEDFLEEFPEHQGASEQDLMKARIDHEYQIRVKLEEQRQEKLKQKQLLIAEVKKGKDDLTKLDGMLETFIEAADPIKKALATE